jgi:hypothetical protein
MEVIGWIGMNKLSLFFSGGWVVGGGVEFVV